MAQQITMFFHDGVHLTQPADTGRWHVVDHAGQMHAGAGDHVAWWDVFPCGFRLAKPVHCRGLFSPSGSSVEAFARRRPVQPTRACHH